MADIQVETPHMQLHQVVDRAFSKTMLAPLDDEKTAANPKDAQSREKSLSRLHAILIRQARRQAPGRINVAVRQIGAPFIDGGIIGEPPKMGDPGPHPYVSGPNAEQLTRLRASGLDIRVLAGSPDAASALKMSYAGLTKGLTALGSIMLLAATRAGTAPVPVSGSVCGTGGQPEGVAGLAERFHPTHV